MTLTALTSCCGSIVWAEAMFARQPFASSQAMHEAADEVWWSLKPEDWLQAFAQHPRIGQRPDMKWAAQEQNGMDGAAERTAHEMASLNEEYYSKFGFIFIVCATGKSAEQMLDLLRTRIHNSIDAEMQAAAAEQAKITHLRLDKLRAE